MNVSKTTRCNMWTFRVRVSDVPGWDFLEALRENGSVAYASYGLGGPDDYDISLGVHTEATGLELLAIVIDEATKLAEHKSKNRASVEHRDEILPPRHRRSGPGVPRCRPCPAPGGKAQRERGRTMIHLTVKQGRILIRATYHGIQDRQALIDAYTPRFGAPGPDGSRELRKIKREVANYAEVRQAIFAQLPKARKAQP